MAVQSRRLFLLSSPERRDELYVVWNDRQKKKKEQI